MLQVSGQKCTKEAQKFKIKSHCYGKKIGSNDERLRKLEPQPKQRVLIKNCMVMEIRSKCERMTRYDVY